MPGLVLAAVLLPLSAQPLMRAVVFALVLINALNLLPFVPLDGGRLMNAVLFSRHRYLELGGTVVGLIGLVAVPDLLPGPPAVWAGLGAGLLIHRSRMIEASAALRRSTHTFDGLTSKLPAESLRALELASSALFQGSMGSERSQASTMAALHEQAATRPARWLHSIVLLATWGAALGLGWSTWQELRHPAPRWTEARGPEQAWYARFPALAGLETKAHPFPGVAAVHQYGRVGPLGEFLVLSVVLEAELRLEDDPTDALRRLKAMVVESEQKLGFKTVSQTATEWERRPALDVTFMVKGQTIESLFVASGNMVHVLSTSRTSASDRALFRESFHLLR